jgi:hypothetical protein
MKNDWIHYQEITDAKVKCSNIVRRQLLPSVE